MTTDPETTQPASRPEPRRGNVRYYSKVSNVLYRTTDDSVSRTPDQILHSHGWERVIGRGYGASFDPHDLWKLSVESVESAMEIARANGLPTEGWDDD